MADKPLSRAESLDVAYSIEHWRLLRNLRAEAEPIMVALEKAYLPTIVHGSIARGDVSLTSDIDVFIPRVASSFKVETALERDGVQIKSRKLIQATPLYAVKAYIEIDERRSVSFPLSRLRRVEREFYLFGGEATLDMLSNDERSVGVDKRLMLIEPTDEGHVESSIVGCEELVAKTLRLSVESVLDRVKALLRRASTGRTGLFLKYELSPEETFESALKKIADENPAVRRRLRTL